jgi:hypothetical protein
VSLSFVFNPITGNLDLVNTGDTTTTSFVSSVTLENVDCDSSVAVGDWVKMDTGVAYRAQANNEADSGVIGVVDSKASLTVCTVVTYGLTSAIFSSLDDTKEYFLEYGSPAGRMTDIPITTTGGVLVKLGRPFSSTRFLVAIGKRTLRA